MPWALRWDFPGFSPRYGSNKWQGITNAPIVIIVTFLLLSPFFRNVREPYSVYEMPPLPEEGVAEENGIEGIIRTRILRSRTITPLVF